MTSDNKNATTTDGFTRLPNTLLEHSDLTLHELIVYLVLLKYRNPRSGRCWPGLSTIADEARVSHKTATRAIKSLESRGVIRVSRARDRGEKNRSNVYEVALYDESLQCWIGQSAKGTRQPTRPRRSTDSESPPSEDEPSSTDSESVGGDSESVEVGTPSPPNKIYKNKNHEQAPRSGFPPDTVHFSTSEDRATERQLALLSDLWIHATANTPPQRMREKWSSMTLIEAQELIPQYYAAIKGRIGMYDGPEHGTPAYMALSPTGKKWAATGMDPDTARQLEGAA